MKLRVKSPAKPRAELHTKPLAKPRAELHTKPLAKPLTVRLTKPLVKLLLAHRKAALLSAPCRRNAVVANFFRSPTRNSSNKNKKKCFACLSRSQILIRYLVQFSGWMNRFITAIKVTSPYVPGKKLSSHSRKDKRADAQQANKRSSLRKNSNTSTR